LLVHTVVLAKGAELTVTTGLLHIICQDLLKGFTVNVLNYKKYPTQLRRQNQMGEQICATSVKPIVPAVFVYVTNIKKSIEWYCKLLGLPIPDKSREDIHIFDLSENHCSNIFLEKRDEVNPSSEPLFSLTAPNIEETFQFLNEVGAEITHRDNEVIWFKDPDGNVLMACSI
jgi:hypothetical protein